jgi:site-specific DNA recombinase
MPSTRNRERPTAAIYARLSRNRTPDERDSTRRQVESCKKLAKAKGLRVEHVLIDDDISAYSGKVRPGYQQLLGLIETDQIQCVIAWHQDRLHRSPIELEQFVQVVNAHTVTVHTVVAGDIDLTTASGLLHAGMLGQVARYESAHRSERILAAKDANAAAGRWGGGTRPYGYQHHTAGEGLTIDTAEAAAVREACARVVAGERVGTVARDFNARGIAPMAAKSWSITSLSRVVFSPTIAGRLIHRGEDVGPADWPPIIDSDTAAKLQAIDGRRIKRGRAAKVALLTGGRLVCSKCGTAMTTAQKPKPKPKAEKATADEPKTKTEKAKEDEPKPEKPTRLYRCTTCYRSIRAEPVEQIITELIFARLDDAKLSAPSKPTTGGDDLYQLESELEALAEDMGAGVISRGEWTAARTPLLARISAARSAIEASLSETPVPGLGAPGGLRAAWPELNLDQREQVVSVFVEQVICNERTKAGPVFEPERLQVIWKQ